MVGSTVEKDRRAGLASVALILAACLPLGAQEEPRPVGPDFQVNTYTTSDQEIPEVSVGSTGDFIVVWNSAGQDGSFGGIYGRRFAADASPLGGEFQVNQATTGSQSVGEGSVSTFPGGGYVVVWSSPHEGGVTARDVFARLYDAMGDPVGDEFMVNTHTPRSQDGPLVSTTSGGEFVVAWTSYLQDGDGHGVFAQRFDAGGLRIGAEFQVNAYTTAGQYASGLSTSSTGGFVVVWDSAGQDGSGFGVFGRAFDQNNAPRGADFQVNSHTMGYQAGGIAVPGRNNDFVVVWSDYGASSYADVVGRVLADDGTPRGPEIEISDSTTDAVFHDVSGPGSGEFVVVWTEYDGPLHVIGRRFGADGEPIGAEFGVPDTPGAQFWPSVGTDSRGDFVVAWTQSSRDGDGRGVFAQRFNSPVFFDGFESDDFSGWTMNVP